MTRDQLVALYARKMNGESMKTLAAEAGLANMQALQGAFRKAGLSAATMSEKTEIENAPEDTTQFEGAACKTPAEEPKSEPVAVTEAAAEEKLMGMLDDLLSRPMTGTEEPVATEQPKPATKKPVKTFDPEKVAEAVALKRSGAKWSKVGELLGCSWNQAWSMVNAVAPALCSKSK